MIFSAWNNREKQICGVKVMRSLKCVLVFAALAVLPGTSHAATIYWNLFNREGDSTSTARYATYATLNDMLNDTNRLLATSPAPNGGSAG